MSEYHRSIVLLLVDEVVGFKYRPGLTNILDKIVFYSMLALTNYYV